MHLNKIKKPAFTKCVSAQLLPKKDEEVWSLTLLAESLTNLSYKEIFFFFPTYWFFLGYVFG